MVKLKSKQEARQKNNFADAASQETINQLANQLADKPYGQKIPFKPRPPKESPQQIESMTPPFERITISLPIDLRRSLEDLVIKRKRTKQKGASVSAIVREALHRFKL